MIPNISWGADFAGIVRYLTVNRDHKVMDLQGVSTIELAADEMSALASHNSRAKNKLLHLSLSAAHEDGCLDTEEWLRCVALLTTALCLDGHMRVIVRHSDKTHDHVHVFFCTIAPGTGLTPPKRWFLKKGSGINDVGPHALTDAQVLSTAPERRALRTYDFRALARCMHGCRTLERALKLRQLAMPTEAARERAAGGEKSVTAEQQKRAERTGSVPLLARAVEIRSALTTRDWPSKQRSLQEIGLEIELVQRTTKKGIETRGVVIVDMADRGNRVPASAFDLPGLKFGLRRMEERHEVGIERVEQWWPQRQPAASNHARTVVSETSELKHEFELLRLSHKFSEREKREKRTRLRREQALARTAKSRALMRRRRQAAVQLPPSERRAFYKTFSIEVACPDKATLAAKQTHERQALAPARVATWQEFVAARVPVSTRPIRSIVVRNRVAGRSHTTAGKEQDRKQVRQNGGKSELASETAVGLMPSVEPPANAEGRVRSAERGRPQFREQDDLFQQRRETLQRQKQERDDEWVREPGREV